MANADELTTKLEQVKAEIIALAAAQYRAEKQVEEHQATIDRLADENASLGDALDEAQAERNAALDKLEAFRVNLKDFVG